MPERPARAASDIDTSLEREVKLGVAASFVLPAEFTDPTRARYEGRLSLRAAYYDTSDLRLAREGITLRHRSGDGPAVWTLKVPAASGVTGERVERSVPGTPEVIAPELASLVIGHTRSASLVEVARLTTRRDTWALFDPSGDVHAEFVDDLVSLVKNGKVVARFRELEVERKGITDSELDAVITQLTEHGATRGVFASKLARALGPQANASGDVPKPVTVRKKDPAGALVVQLLRASVRRLIAQDIGVRLGHDDAVHQMRVACRRLRSDLRTFGPLFEPGATDTLREELAWLASALGDARDVEVLRARLIQTVSADPLAPLDPAAFARLDEILRERQVDALSRVAAALDDTRYADLLELAVATTREPGTNDQAKIPARDALPPLLAKTLKGLDKKVRALGPETPDDTWHAARIRAKRARYAAEACSAALGKPARKTGSAMAAVQEVLGDHQDAAVAADVVISIAGQHPDDADLVLLCGRLAERERAAVRKTRRRFDPVWKKANAKSVREWLPAAAHHSSKG